MRNSYKIYKIVKDVGKIFVVESNNLTKSEQLMRYILKHEEVTCVVVYVKSEGHISPFKKAKLKGGRIRWEFL